MPYRVSASGLSARWDARAGPTEWPRAIHSSRCGASAPIEVASPCPVYTSVSPGSVSTFSRDGVDDRVEVTERPARRTRTTGEQSVTTEQHLRLRQVQTAQTLANGPGVLATRNLVQAIEACPSDRSSCPTPGCIWSTASGHPGAHRIRVSNRSANSGATVMWSLWAWVQITDRTRRPPTASTIASASWAASTTITSSSSPISQMLLSTSTRHRRAQTPPWVTTRSIRSPISRRRRTSRTLLGHSQLHHRSQHQTLLHLR